MIAPTTRLLALLLHAAPLALAIIFPVRAATPNVVAAWAASAQQPCPTGNATAQPELRFAFPNAARGATGQSFRLIVPPEICDRQARIGLSSAFGTRSVTLDAVCIGQQQSGSAILSGTSYPVAFSGASSVPIAAGKSALSDAVDRPFVQDSADTMLTGRHLSVSFHVDDVNGPMPWRAKALTTSYIAASGFGVTTTDGSELAFPYSSISWYFLDAVDMNTASGTAAIVAFGDWIADGTASTINRGDRWPDVFVRQLHVVYGDKYAVVNAGIDGGMVIGQADHTTTPTAGGPAAIQRLACDVISLSSVKTVTWLEGINDLGNVGTAPEDVARGERDIVQPVPSGSPRVRVFMATLTSALHSSDTALGTVSVNDRRHAYNKFIRTERMFDGVIDFDAATLDPESAELPNSFTGGPEDKLHPNQARYLAMRRSIDPRVTTGGPKVIGGR